MGPSSRVSAGTLLHISGNKAKLLYNKCFKSSVDFLKYDSLHKICKDIGKCA